MQAAQAQAAIPYCGPAPAPGALWLEWNFDPALVAGLLALLAWGLARGRGTAFLLGWSALVLAFVSPLCALTTALFTARTLHHLLLVAVAAPAFAMALPIRRIPGGAALAASAAGLVLWHVPQVYAAAWDSAALYWLLQLLLFLPAWAFWSAMLAPDRQDGVAILVNALLVGALAGVMGLIGAVLSFSGAILYPQHITGAQLWGLDALADQQAAGLVMWVPGLLPLAALAALMARRAWWQSMAA